MIKILFLCGLLAICQGGKFGSRATASAEINLEAQVKSDIISVQTEVSNLQKFVSTLDTALNTKLTRADIEQLSHISASILARGNQLLITFSSFLQNLPATESKLIADVQKAIDGIKDLIGKVSAVVVNLNSLTSATLRQLVADLFQISSTVGTLLNRILPDLVRKVDNTLATLSYYVNTIVQAGAFLRGLTDQATQAATADLERAIQNVLHIAQGVQPVVENAVQLANDIAKKPNLNESLRGALTLLVNLLKKLVPELTGIVRNAGEISNGLTNGQNVSKLLGQLSQNVNSFQVSAQGLSQALNNLLGAVRKAITGLLSNIRVNLSLNANANGSAQANGGK